MGQREERIDLGRDPGQPAIPGLAVPSQGLDHPKRVLHASTDAVALLVEHLVRIIQLLTPDRLLTHTPLHPAGLRLALRGHISLIPVDTLLLPMEAGLHHSRIMGGGRGDRHGVHLPLRIRTHLLTSTGNRSVAHGKLCLEGRYGA